MTRLIYLSTILFIVLCSITLFSPFSDAQQNGNNLQSSDVQAEPNDQNGDFRWVSDDLFTYLRAGPSKGYRLLGSVNAGTKIQLLQINEEAGFAEIIDDKQRTGWIETSYIQANPSFRDAFNSMKSRLNVQEVSTKSMKSQLLVANQSLSKSNNQKTQLNRQVTQQLEDISRLKELLEKRERSSNMQWFTRGGILATVALLIGYIMGITGRKRKSRNSLM